MKNNFLHDLESVKALDSSYFIELTKGYYTTDKDCWDEQSIYIHGDFWANCLHELAHEIIANYDFFVFFDISEQDNQNFCQALLELATKLDKLTKFSELQADNFLSENGQPYIRFDNSLHDIIAEAPNQTERVFNKNFARNIKIIANTYRDLAVWLTENRSYGVSILGI